MKEPVLTWKDYAVGAGLFGVALILYSNRFRRVHRIPDPGGGATATPYQYEEGYYGDILEGTDYNPDPLSREIADALEGFTFFAHPDVTEGIVELEPAELLSLYNHYNAHYASSYPTLTQLLVARDTYPNAGIYTPATYYLQSLGLNDAFPWHWLI